MRRDPDVPKTPTKWWQDGKTLTTILKEPHYLTQGVFAFFQQVRDWLLFPINQMNAETCHSSVLTLMAWDRKIERFDGEGDALFRKRVQFAFVNARDAGTVFGFKRIFYRLGIGIVSFRERVDAENWDVCEIELLDSDISNQSRLIKQLIEQYGRTCRRYQIVVSYQSHILIVMRPYHHTHQLFYAEQRG